MSRRKDYTTANALGDALVQRDLARAELTPILVERDKLREIVENVWELCRTPETVTRTTPTGHTYHDWAIPTDLLERILEGEPLPW